MKRLKIMAALLAILSLAFLCVACGNKPVNPVDEDGTPGTAQQDTVTDDKTAAEDKASKDNTNSAEDGTAAGEPLEFGGGLVDDPFEDDTTSTPSTPVNNKPGTSSGNSGNSGNSDKPSPYKNLKWEEFYALSSEEKDAYKNSFDSKDAFFDWMIDAQNKFTKEHPDIEIGADGTIDLSKLK